MKSEIKADNKSCLKDLLIRSTFPFLKDLKEYVQQCFCLQASVDHEWLGLSCGVRLLLSTVRQPLVHCVTPPLGSGGV